MILLVDHDDSFVHVLAGYLTRLGVTAEVRRASALTLADVAAPTVEGVILSPGPRRPEDCPLALDVVGSLGSAKPILGVCLGHQVIVTACGGRVEPCEPRHGMTSPVSHDGIGIFAGLPSPLNATRYHSLAAVPDRIPDQLVVSARADDGVIMAVRHREWPVTGVQFHPESILTDSGMRMVENWVRVRDSAFAPSAIRPFPI